MERMTFSSEMFTVWLVNAASTGDKGSSEATNSLGLGCGHSTKVKSLVLVWKNHKEVSKWCKKKVGGEAQTSSDSLKPAATLFT